MNTPMVKCRMCLMTFPANNEKEHTSLCFQRLENKNRSSQVDRKFLDLQHEITKNISYINKVYAGVSYL